MGGRGLKIGQHMALDTCSKKAISLYTENSKVHEPCKA
jgi:hypothetical protein